MARPVEFDRTQAVLAALFLFWRQGYLATSLVQLLDVMNISRSSFYAAFKDKRSLFIEALEHYDYSRYQDQLERISQNSDAASAIKEYVLFSLKPAKPASIKDGCLIVNTLLELRGVDDELAEIASDMPRQLEAAFTQCFKNAMQAGSLSDHMPPAELTKLFTTFNQGLRVSSRRGVAAEELLAQTDAFIGLICNKPEPRFQKQTTN